MDLNVWALGGVAAITLATLVMGIWGARAARTTSDLLVARQVVREERNAAAISGEYLSAASFLGIAGLVLKEGVDALWYPIGFAGGYLVLLLLIASPLRRSGAYTLPDFAEARLDSLQLRWLVTAFVVLVGWSYLVPQLQGAGMALSTISGLPYWCGVVAVAAIVLASVLTGGMRAVTLVQAFQYWVKLFAITLPAFVLLMVFLSDGSPSGRSWEEPRSPVFEEDTTVRVETDVRLGVGEPVWVQVVEGSGPGPFTPGTVYVRPGEYPVAEGAELRFPAGTPVPVVEGAEPDNASWLRAQDDGWPGMLTTYSLILATFLGTMGLPHVLVRYYANPSGHGARRTTLYVLGMLGAFYLFPVVFGLLSRLYVPELLVTGETDAAVLLLPGAMLEGWLGGLLGAITAAGAFAAFLSASSGLVVSVAAVISTDLLRGKSVDSRLISLVAAAVPTVFALVVVGSDLARGVGLAFAMAASTFCPLLVLGVWWRRLTAVGASAGMLSGGGVVLVAMLLGSVVDGEPSTWWLALIHQPALVSVPLAFLVTIAVSRGTSRQDPNRLAQVMLRMHAPDRLGFFEGAGSVGLRERLGVRSPAHGRHRRRS